MLSPRSRGTQKAQVYSLLDRTGVTGEGELVGGYGSSLADSLSKSVVPEKFMRVLLDKLQQF